MTSIGRWTPVSLVLVGALALAGCADQKASMTAQGAGVGAVGGAVIGGLFGGTRGAAIGALAGAAAGGLGGYALGSQQEQFASTEQELQVRTERARNIAATQRDEANRARTAAANYERSLAPLSQQVAAGRRLNDSQRNTLARAQADRDDIRAKLEAGTKASDEIRAAVANLRQKGQNTSALESEGRDLSASNARLQGALDRMNSALGKIEA
ncbi:MAG: hypothetical protein IT555_15895 [Acetobacteraceae bacterium]|nr:hypothetical protein [Acetobacteraceae bacterium]